MFGVKGILIVVMLILLFGGAIYDMTTTAGRCGLSFTDPESNYSCDEFGITALNMFTTPDKNIERGVNGILSIRNLDNQTLSDIGIVRESQTVRFQHDVFLGLAGLIVLIGFFTWLGLTMSPSSNIDAGGKALAVLFAIVIVTSASIIGNFYDGGDSQAPGAIFGKLTPFPGLRSLIFNTDVLGEVVDESSILPGTLNTGDIINGTLP